MLGSKRNKPFIFEGLEAEKYKQMRNKWFRLAVVSVFLPFLFAIAVSYYTNTFDLLGLFGNGEILLSLFSLTTPMLLDLFEMKSKEDEYLSWAFFFCAILVCFQVLLYCLTRIEISEKKEMKSIVVSVIMLITSWLCCGISIKAMFLHSIMDEKVKDDIRVVYKRCETEINKEKNAEFTLEINKKIGFSKFDLKDYTKELLRELLKIYPEAIFNVSIRLLKSADIEKPEESTLFTWFGFPPQMQDEQNLYTIKHNTAFKSLIENNGKFFFVSDLKKYSALKSYENESKNYIRKYNTTMVFPIRKKGTDKKYDIIGFLCVDSPQNLKNVKKNERVISLVETAASVIYDFLKQNKDEQEIFSLEQ